MELRLLFFVVLAPCLCTDSVQSLRILGLFPYHGKSHFFVFKAYLEELARRGHDLTVVSHFPNPNSGYKDISLAGTVKILQEDVPLDRSFAIVAGVIYELGAMSADNCETMLESKEVQNLWKTKQKFDLVVTEQFNSDCTLGLAHKLGAPVVALTSHVLMPWHYSRLGIPDNLAFVPSHFLGGGSRPTFFERIGAAVLRTYATLVYKYVSQRPNKISLEKRFGSIPDLDELAKDVKFTLLYQYFPLTGSRLFSPNVVEVGGYHVAKVKPLPEDLRKFIEDSEHGVVYVSFGSQVKTSSLSSERLDAIIKALSSLKQRFIWKWENETLPGNPPNILPRKWLPQNDILAHPKVLAFYSHGGMLGTTEAIHHGVPVVVMPVVGDQPANAASVRESGLGVQLDIAELSAETLLEKLQEVLHPEFRAHVKELSRAWHDRPLPAMDAAVFWTEFAARYAGRSWRPHSLDVPFYRYYSLDLIATAVAVLALVFFVFVRCCCSRRSVTKTTAKSKTKAKRA